MSKKRLSAQNIRSKSILLDVDFQGPIQKKPFPCSVANTVGQPLETYSVRKGASNYLIMSFLLTIMQALGFYEISNGAMLSFHHSKS